MTDKTSREETIRTFPTYLNALLNTSCTEVIIDIENNTYPESLSLSIDGKTSEYRLKNFARVNGSDNYLERIYLKIS